MDLKLLEEMYSAGYAPKKISQITGMSEEECEAFARKNHFNRALHLIRNAFESNMQYSEMESKFGFSRVTIRKFSKDHNWSKVKRSDAAKTDYNVDKKEIKATTEWPEDARFDKPGMCIPDKTEKQFNPINQFSDLRGYY